MGFNGNICNALIMHVDGSQKVSDAQVVIEAHKDSGSIQLGVFNNSLPRFIFDLGTHDFNMLVTNSSHQFINVQLGTLSHCNDSFKIG